jgi:radical SAM protein with 4Fe4S-binding SPASM domain
LNGTSFLNIELTSRCNKSCWMCGRRRIENERPDLADWGDMSPALVHKLAQWEVRRDVVIQFHNNGEPLLYPSLWFALDSFKGNIRCLNTNGKLLMEKADEIIGNLETLTISVIENDPEGDEQYEIVRRFLEKKGSDKPFIVYRLLGEVDRPARWEALPGVHARRVLHSPYGSREYRKCPTIPEIGVCLDLLTHLAIDRKGNVSMCVRFDPEGDLRLGNVGNMSLEECWRSEKRRRYINWHLAGQREMLPGCNRCDYWGVPRG